MTVEHEQFSIHTTEDRLKLIKESLDFIYDEQTAQITYDKIVDMIRDYQERIVSKPYILTQKMLS